jgi:hypothetical protein
VNDQLQELDEDKQTRRLEQEIKEEDHIGNISYPKIRLHEAPPSILTSGSHRRVSTNVPPADGAGAWACTDTGPEGSDKLCLMFKDSESKVYKVYTAKMLRDKVEANPKL